MGATLDVHLNRAELHAVEPASEAVETTGSFNVRFRNHGRAVHVHVKLEGPLSHVASLPEPNHFVDTDGTTTVPVEVEADTSDLDGWLTVVSGYGSESADVTVRLRSPEQPRRTVAVADDGGDGEEDGLLARLPAGGVGAGVALAAALALVAVALAPSPTVAAAAVGVVVAAGGAGYLFLA